jgi:hypothetical protein
MFLQDRADKIEMSVDAVIEGERDGGEAVLRPPGYGDGRRGGLSEGHAGDDREKEKAGKYSVHRDPSISGGKRRAEDSISWTRQDLEGRKADGHDAARPCLWKS